MPWASSSNVWRSIVIRKQKNNHKGNIYNKINKLSQHQRQWSSQESITQFPPAFGHRPATSDQVLLSTSHEEGHVYIETANLDGETNLKTKMAWGLAMFWVEKYINHQVETPRCFYVIVCTKMFLCLAHVWGNWTKTKKNTSVKQRATCQAPNLSFKLVGQHETMEQTALAACGLDMYCVSWPQETQEMWI